MVTRILEQIGLSKNEIKVYFALLELNQASATPIMKKSGVPHSKVYPVLERLARKGLVSHIIRKNVRFFQASSPRNLIDILNEKEKQIKLQKLELEKAIPQIELNRKLGEGHQEAAIYEGLEGIKTALNLILETMNPGDEYLVFSLGEELRSRQLRRIYASYQNRRIERKINVRLIANKKLEEIFSKYHNYRQFNVRYTDLRLPTGIFIFGDHVLNVVWGKKPTAFLTTSKYNAKEYAAFFEQIWKAAKV
jgi:sugar-specific transcriptional regulator TrmB